MKKNKTWLVNFVQGVSPKRVMADTPAGAVELAIECSSNEFAEWRARMEKQYQQSMTIPGGAKLMISMEVNMVELCDEVWVSK